MSVSSVNTLNKASTKLKNIYHIKFIDNLEGLTIRAKGYIGMEKVNTMVNPFTQLYIDKQEEKGKERKKDKRLKPDYKPQWEICDYFTPLNLEVSMA